MKIENANKMYSRQWTL